MTKLITVAMASTLLSVAAQAAPAASGEMRIAKSMTAIADESVSNPAALATPVSASPSATWPYSRDSGAAVRVTVGQRVRVTVADPGRFTGTITGTLVRTGADGLTVLDDRRAVSELPASSVTRLEVSQGKKRKTREYAVIGAVMGAVFGALASSDSENTYQLEIGNSSACGDYVGNAYIGRTCTSGEKAVWTIGSAAALGGFGAWFGHRKATEIWSDAPVKVTLAPLRGGGRAALSFGF